MRVWGLKPSPTIAINERSRQLQELGRPIYRLGIGQSPFPVPRYVGEALQRHAFEKDYLPVRGLAALREAVAEHIAADTVGNEPLTTVTVVEVPARGTAQS